MIFTGLTLTLLACGADTTSGDSGATTDDTNTGPVYDNSFCEEGGLTDGQQACCDYIAAYNTCADTYGSTDWKDAGTTGCEVAGESARTSFECLADVYESADCASSDGWNAAIQAATGC